MIEPEAPTPVPALAQVAARLQHLDVADAIDLGFSFASPTDHYGYRVAYARPVGGLAAGTLTLILSPQRGHRALQWHEDKPDRLQLWIDAREIAVPSDEGRRLIEPSGWWASERLFATDTKMPDHPLQEWSRAPVVGTVFGLLICDAQTTGQRWEQPRDDEVWTKPLLRIEGNHVRLYADDAAYDADTPAREWTL